MKPGRIAEKLVGLRKEVMTALWSATALTAVAYALIPTRSNLWGVALLAGALILMAADRQWSRKEPPEDEKAGAEPEKALVTKGYLRTPRGIKTITTILAALVTAAGMLWILIAGSDYKKEYVTAMLAAGYIIIAANLVWDMKRRKDKTRTAQNGGRDERDSGDNRSD